MTKGVDFLLAPYLSEPIGQTDVELGLLGVPWVTKKTSHHRPITG